MQRQQRAGQRERQREHRVAEADERGVGSELGSRFRGSGSGFEPLRRPADRCPPTRYSSTSSTPAGTRDGDQRRALARLDRAELVAEAERRGAVGVALSSSARAGTDGRQPRASPPARRTGSDRRRWPGCRCRPRPGRPTRRSASIGGIAGAGPAVAARTGHQRRARRRQPGQLGVGQLHAVHGQQPVATAARADRGTPPDRTPAAATPDSRRRAPRAAPRHRAAAVARGTRPPRATRQVHADSGRPATLASRSPRSSAGDTEYGACGARLMRTEAVDRQRRRSARRAATTRAAASGSVEADQLVEHVRAAAALAAAADTVASVLLMSPTSAGPGSPALRRSPRRMRSRISARPDRGRAAAHIDRANPRRRTMRPAAPGRAATTARDGCAR